MRVVAFRHVPFEDIGRIRASLEAGGVEVETCDLPAGTPLPDTAGAAGLIFMGGPMSANDDLSYLQTEMDLIREAARLGQPVLGICLGSQLIAKALGAAVYRNSQKEIGWFPIHLTPDAQGDTLFQGLPSTLPMFHWHGETFDLPSGSTWLAWSERCRHQAFRVGGNIYGLQCHPEVTPAMIADWCLQDANCGDVRELEGPIDPQLHARELEELSRGMFARWVGLL